MFPFFRQLDRMDCGPTCLRMIAAHYGKEYSLQFLRDRCYITKEGVSLLGIEEAANHIGFRAIPFQVPFDEVDEEHYGIVNMPLPCIAHWNQRHFVVVYKIKGNKVWIADPAHGRIKLTRQQFEKSWISDDNKGILLAMEPTPAFYSQTPDKAQTLNTRFILNYLRPYTKLVSQFGLSLILATLFQFLFPFLTQSIVDTGIAYRNMGFVTLILIAQLVLFFSQTFLSFIQTWINLQLGARINANLSIDFLSKLMRLPIGFFDSKMTGDLIQRLSDNNRIETFLTQSTLNILLSLLTFIVYSLILLFYNPLIFAIFIGFAVIYVGWVRYFMRKRKEIDYLSFQQNALNQQSLYELIHGMQEIKLQGSERKRKWRWLDIQVNLFRIKMRALMIGQYQDIGAGFFNQLKNIFISFLAAKAVIDNQMTLGMMMSVQFIVGQLNSPLQQFIFFLRGLQDARISLERLSEIHNMDDEERPIDELGVIRQAEELPHTADLLIENVSFQYTPISPQILSGIHLTIPAGKTTAIVGVSGSGKTTLLKLILGFYKPVSGRIMVGKHNLDYIDKRLWRSQCGAVMQDGFIFSDSIAQNIAESDERVHQQKVADAVRVANLESFIDSLPLGYNTMIGARGNGLSQGQKQRILIARAVYRNPNYIFFDEATNALDANNEKVILNNLASFVQGKTVVVVAHRLSTVKNADQIVVLDKGQIVEQGTHSELITSKGYYYNLIRDQLDLE